MNEEILSKYELSFILELLEDKIRHNHYCPCECRCFDDYLPELQNISIREIKDYILSLV